MGRLQLLAATFALLAIISCSVQAELCDKEGVDVCMSYFDGSVAEVHRASESEWYLVSSNSRAKVNQLYKSVDSGCTWSNVMAALEEGFEPDSFSGYAGVRGIELAASGSTSRAAYFIGFGNRFWTTEGGTWGSYLLHHIDEASITIDPLLQARDNDGETAEVLSIVNIDTHDTTGPYALLTALVGLRCDNECENRTRYQVLLATTDQGSNWGFLANYVTQSAWLGHFYSVGWVSQAEELSVSGSSQIFDFRQRDAATLQRFYVTRDLGSSIAFTSPPGVIEINLQEPDILFVVTISTLSFDSAPDPTEVIDSTNFDEDQLSLWVSNGGTWRRCDLPADLARGMTASALHVTPSLRNGAAFINVQFGSNDYGSLMAASTEPFESTSSFSFWETLPDNTVSPSVLDSLANSSDPTAKFSSLRQTENNDGTERFGLEQVVNFFSVPVGDSPQGTLLANVATESLDRPTSLDTVTVFSATLGATWDYAQLSPCLEENCFVHIFGPGDSAVFTGQESSYSSPLAAGGTGLVLATGNSDTVPTVDGQGVLMLSRDAGRTWSVVREDQSLFATSSGGDVFLSASRQPSEGGELSFSLDQSLSFINCELLSQTEELLVDNVYFIEEGTDELSFVAAGAYAEDSDTGFLSVLSFASAVPMTECAGFDEPDTSGSDYESWTPTDCFMGDSRMFIRRKALPRCFTGAHSWGSTAGEPCPCSRADYWCDGSSFEIEAGGNLFDSMCVSIDPCRNVTCAGHEGEDITVSQGYALVPGDSCAGGDDLSPVVITCPMGFEDSANEDPGLTTYTAIDYASRYRSYNIDYGIPIDDEDSTPLDWTLIVYLSVFGVVVVVLLVATVVVFALFAYHRCKDIMNEDEDENEGSYVYDELDELDDISEYDT